MKLRISSVAASGVGELISDVTTGLEDQLRPVLESKNYGGGVEQFSAFYISVGSDPEENRPYCEMHNRSGKYKNILTGKMISYVGIAIPVDPVRVLSSSKGALRELLVGLFLEQLETPAYSFPKKFDGQGFLIDLKSLLA